MIQRKKLTPNQREWNRLVEELLRAGGTDEEAPDRISKKDLEGIKEKLDARVQASKKPPKPKRVRPTPNQKAWKSLSDDIKTLTGETIERPKRISKSDLQSLASAVENLKTPPDKPKRKRLTKNQKAWEELNNISPFTKARPNRITKTALRDFEKEIEEDTGAVFKSRLIWENIMEVLIELPNDNISTKLISYWKTREFDYDFLESRQEVEQAIIDYALQIYKPSDPLEILYYLGALAELMGISYTFTINDVYEFIKINRRERRNRT